MIQPGRQITVRQAMLEGLVISLAGPGILFALTDYLLPQSARFANRWDGGCTGWTRELAMLTGIADFLQWAGYVTICIVVLRLHPIVQRVKTRRFGIPLTRLVPPAIAAIFFLCATGHLLDAYSIWVPVYTVAMPVKLLGGVVAVVGAYVLATTLVHAFAAVKAARERYEKLEREIERRGR